MPRPPTEERVLTVELTPEERRQKGDELAEAVLAAEEQRKEIARKAAQWSATKKALQSALAEDEAACERLARIVESGEEERRVACSWLYSLEHGLAFLVRDDTGALVAHRDLAEEERQADLLDSYREPTPDQLAEWLPEVDAAETEAAAEDPLGEELAEIAADGFQAGPGWGETEEDPFNEEADLLARMAASPDDLEGEPAGDA